MKRILYITKDLKPHSDKDCCSAEGTLAIGNLFNNIATIIKRKIKFLLFNKTQFNVTNYTGKCDTVYVELNPDFIETLTPKINTGSTDNPLADNGIQVITPNVKNILVYDQQLEFVDSIVESNTSTLKLKDSLLQALFNNQNNKVKQFIIYNQQPFSNNITQDLVDYMNTDTALSLDQFEIGVIDFYDNNLNKVQFLFGPGKGDYGIGFTTANLGMLYQISSSSGEVSATQKGIVNNVELQELGGVDKLINGVRIGQGKTSGQESTALGVEVLINDVGGYNTGVGYQVLKSNTTGVANDGFGDSTLSSNTTGTYNSAFGTGSLQDNISGTQNMGFGGYSLYKNTTGSRNVGVGLSALQQNNGSFNTAIGNHAGSSTGTTIKTGNSNITIGFQAGRDITTGNNNLLIENITNASITSGSNNIMLNPRQKSGVTTGSNNVIIGGYDGAFPANMSDTIVLGTGNGVTRVFIDPNGNAGIGTITPTAKLHSVGTVRHENITNAQGDSTFTKQVVAKVDGTFGIEDKVLNRQVFYVTGRIDQTGNAAPIVTISSQDINDVNLTFTTQYISTGWYLISVASTLITLTNYKIEAFIQDKAFGSLSEAITDDTKFEFQGNTMVLLSLRNGALTDGITANQFSIHLYRR